jgi:hypothetical protein
MISPYTAVGLVPTVRGIRKREDIKINLEHLAHLVKAATWRSSLDLPVRLIAIPEGAAASVPIQQPRSSACPTQRKTERCGVGPGAAGFHLTRMNSKPSKTVSVDERAQISGP